VIHHIDISWNQGCTGTDQVRFFELEGDTLTITTPPYRRYLDGHESRSMLVWDKVPGG
jgi:Lipocalin-like domain